MVTPKVVVTVSENGVAEVFSDRPVEVLIVDYDVPDDNHVGVTKDAGGQTCALHMESALVDPETVQREYTNWQNRQKTDEELAAAFAKIICDRGFDENDLDFDVDEIVSKTATEINNGGLHAQVEFLLSHMGEKGMREWIEETYPAPKAR